MLVSAHAASNCGEKRQREQEPMMSGVHAQCKMALHATMMKNDETPTTKPERRTCKTALEERRNCTKRGTTPHAITSWIGGLRSI